MTSWYVAHCDGDWEHTYGIDIDTVDNPGWSFEVEIGELALEDLPFEPLDVNRSETAYIHCFVRDGKFVGQGGPTNLAEMIEVFLEWAKHENDHDESGEGSVDSPPLASQ